MTDIYQLETCPTCGGEITRYAHSCVATFQGRIASLESRLKVATEALRIARECIAREEGELYRLYEERIDAALSPAEASGEAGSHFNEPCDVSYCGVCSESPAVEDAAGAECRKLSPNAIGPGCSCQGDACALGLE